MDARTTSAEPVITVEVPASSRVVIDVDFSGENTQDALFDPEAEQHKAARRKSIRIGFLAVVAVLVVAGIIVAIVNPRLLADVFAVVLIFLFIVYKMVIKPLLRGLYG